VEGDQLPSALSGRELQQNLELVQQIEEMAAEKGVKPGQLALAWVFREKT